MVNTINPSLEKYREVIESKTTGGVPLFLNADFFKTVISNGFSLGRSIVDALKTKVSVNSKVIKVSDATKLFAFITIPFAIKGAVTWGSDLIYNRELTAARVAECVLNIIGELVTVCEGIGLIGDVIVSFIPATALIAPFATLLGTISAFSAVVYIGIEIIGIVNVEKDRNTMEGSEIDKEESKIFNLRFNLEQVSHSLNITATLCGIISFSLFFFAPPTVLLASAIILSAAITFVLIRIAVDIIADQIMYEQIKAFNLINYNS